MKTINAYGVEFKELNEQIAKESEINIKNCLGQRFIGAGAGERKINIEGTPGNALGAYLNGAEIIVEGNAQDAVGDTMNDGKIIIRGNIGDAAGYAMRGGKIFVKGDAGYRAGIHMKEYEQKVPLLVIGGSAGSFLGEYQAGGVIIVLGIGVKDGRVVGNFPCTGMHGGKMLIRSDCKNVIFPKNVIAKRLSKEDLKEFSPYFIEFCTLFGYNYDDIIDSEFTVVIPDGNNPYKQMYVMN